MSKFHKMNNNQKIRILHLTQVSGGIETYLSHIFTYLNRDAYELLLVCADERKSLIKMAEEKCVRVFPIKMKWKISPVSDFMTIIALVKLLKHLKPQIIHAHSSKAGVIARISGIFYKAKIIYTPNAYAYLGFSGFKRSVFLSIERIMIPFTDCLLASSESEKTRSINDVKFPSSKVLVYPNSIEPQVANDNLEIVIEPNSLPFIITTVGRLVKQKNPMMFVAVCKAVAEKRKNVIFKLIGIGFDDQYKMQLEEYILDNKLTDSVLLQSWMSKAELHYNISKSHIFIMTSLFESFGYVAAEAQLLGKPVVATNVDGLNEIVDNNNTGYIVELDDVATMAKRIIHLMDNPALRKQMGEAGKKRMLMKFNIERNIQYLDVAYSSFLL